MKEERRMELTTKQLEGLKIAVERYKNKEAYTCISGFAGAGKSTLIKFIVAALDIPESEVIYIAYTGKAAEVLRHKGCQNAMTAHKLLYYSSRQPDGKFLFRPRPHLDFAARLIVVDEVSMLPKAMWELLLSHHIYVLACGDPGQLPPISKDTANDILEHPHVFLDEIMRQAAESEIIRLSMDVREGRPLQLMKGNEVQVISKSEVIPGMYSWADEIIVATNKKRNEINKLIRDGKGFGDEPQPGDKVISLCNHWDCSDVTGENALVNGTIGYIDPDAPVSLGSYNYNNVYRYIFKQPIYYISGDIITETGERFVDIDMDYQAFLTGERGLTPKQEWWLATRINKDVHPYEFNYGYAITCHRAQGSEWDKVMVFEENFPFDKEEHKRWLYTAVTRASKKLVLVKK